MAQTGRIVLVASGKGGVGKSTLSVNCGAALALRGKKVLLVDADMGLRSLDLLLGVSDRVIYDLGDVIAARCEPARAIITTDCHNLHLLPSVQNDFAEKINPETLCALYKGLSHYYDFIIIDAPAGIGAGMTVPAKAADTAIIVATPDPVSIRDAEHAANKLRTLGNINLRLVVNRVDSKLIRKNILPDLDAVIDGVAVQLLGIIPEDKHVAVAASKGRPLISLRKGAAMAIRNIAARLDGEDVELMRF